MDSNRPPLEATLTRAWQSAFIAALRETGIVRDACEAAGIVKQTAYNLRHADAEFAARWDEALDDSTDLLEREAVQRARIGVREPVVYQGQLCGMWVDEHGTVVSETTPGARLVPLSVTKYSDALLVFLLKGNRPKKYKDNPPKDQPPDGTNREPVSVYVPDNGRGDGPTPEPVPAEVAD